jgi:hypothetical protein
MRFTAPPSSCFVCFAASCTFSQSAGSQNIPPEQPAAVILAATSSADLICVRFSDLSGRIFKRNSFWPIFLSLLLFLLYRRLFALYLRIRPCSLALLTLILLETLNSIGPGQTERRIPAAWWRPHHVRRRSCLVLLFYFQRLATQSPQSARALLHAN